MHDPDPWFQYQSRPDTDSDYAYGVVDGDTFDLELDKGLRDYSYRRGRLVGVDTAEIHGGTPHDSDEHARGTEHREFVLSWIEAVLDAHDGAWPFVVHTYGDELGRYCRLRIDLEAKGDLEGFENDLATSLIENYPEVEDE